MSDPSSHDVVPAADVVGQPQPAGGSSRTSTADDPQRTVISSRPPIAGLAVHGPLAAESAARWEGEQLGQFILQKFIGGGGMGIVFRALDTTLDREVAVKVLSRDQSADEETLRRFRNEAQSAARLSHDNIAHVFFVGEDRGVHYIVFEFIDGVNIRDLVERHGLLPLEEAVSYTYQIALALDHASQRSVIHRDIKPSNVLITADGKAKLVDMGLARLNMIAPGGDLTASGVTLGTFDYISPEQARDPRSADVRSDLYSLGCSFYFMLTGRPPFPEGTVLQKLLQHQGDSPPDPRTIRPELPADVTRVVARLLAKNPAQRYQRPAELIDDLALLGQTLGIQLGGSRATWVTPRRRYRLSQWQHHLPWIVPLAALFLVVLGLDFYWSPRASELDSALTLPAVALPAPASPLVERPIPSQPPTAPREASPNTANPPGPAPATPPEVGPFAVPAAPGDDGPPPGPPQAADEAPDVQPAIPRFPSDLIRRLTEIGERARQAARPAPLAPGAADGSDRPLPGNADGAAASPPTLPADAPAVSATPRIVGAAEQSEAAEHVLTVGDQPGARNYQSLYAACSQAQDGDTIELRYSGRRVERPLEIANRRVHIRAADGFAPIVVFQPVGDINPFKNPSAMIGITGGDLTATGVHFQFELPRNVPSNWTLFEVRGCEELDFTRCTFTIAGQGGYGAQAVFFDIKAPPGAKSMNMGNTPADDRVVAITLKDCVARGEATLLRDNELQSIRLSWTNGLLATGDRLFVAGGDPIQPRRDVRAEITLRHVTAVVDAGLVLLTNSKEAPYQVMTQLRADDCVLATSKKGVPLVEQRGSDGIDQYRTRFQFSGDHSYFSGFDVFWQITNASGPTGSSQLDFQQWSELWHGSAAETDGHDSVAFANRPGGLQPFHTHTPADYVLDPGSDHPASGGASDRLDAGAVIAALPVVPEVRLSSDDTLELTPGEP